MKNTLLMLLFLLGLSCQVVGQTPAKGFEGSWQGTLEAGGSKLRLALTVTKSDAGAYAGKVDSLDQGATIPIDTITVNSDAVRLELKSIDAVFEGVLNKDRTELTGKYTQGGQEFPLSFKRSDQAAVVPPPAKDFEGSWPATLEAGGQKLRLVVTVTKSDAGAYAGKFDSLDQGASIPIDTITLTGDAVRFEIKSAAIVYEGTLNKERTELTGTFSQADQKFPLTFKRGDQTAVTPTATPTPKPKPDYSAPADAPYTAEEVVVKTPAGHTLAGTLTLPKSASRTKPVSAIVTVSGSGPQDRDENIGLPGFLPFRQIADSLARRGIAVLRMDDRGTGASGGTFKGSTSADFAEDVRAGLAYLRTRPEIRADRLGVLGHSEGAIIAPMVADKEPTLRAIVLLAGIAQPGRTALYFQIKNGIEHNAKLTPELRTEQIAGIDKRIDAMMAADPWMKFFLTYDPAPTMRRVKTPVLILTGARDQQAVPAEVALQEAAFKEGGNKDVTARVLPDLNHLFVQDTDGFPGNYAKLPAPIMMRADVLTIIGDWLATRLR
ncbi:MAG TPA: alpha/beta fold hydrolase [Pyrinomonadaceae bacterium]|nr:alpha/beta fold hydrolase [Pyrinomonadaceae bacterium]